jgi:hypothetical protein
MQNPELQIFLRKIAQNKVSVSNGIKLRTLQNQNPNNYILSPLIQKVTASDFVFKTTQQPLHKIQSQETKRKTERKALILRI